MAGFMSAPFKTLGMLSTAGAFVGGVAKGLNEQAIAEQESKDADKKYRAQAALAEYKQRQKQMEKMNAAQTFLDGLDGVDPKTKAGIMAAVAAGVPLATALNKMGSGNNSGTSNCSSAAAHSGSGFSNNMSGDDPLAGLGPKDNLQAAQIVKAVESGGNYYTYYDGTNNPNKDLRDYPEMPGYYGARAVPGADNSHAQGAHGWQPDTWRRYAQAYEKAGLGTPNIANKTDQDRVFDFAWQRDGGSNWSPYWNATARQKAWNVRGPASSGNPQQAGNGYTPNQNPMGTGPGVLPPVNPQGTQQAQAPAGQNQGEPDGFADGGEAMPDDNMQQAMFANQSNQQIQQQPQPQQTAANPYGCQPVPTHNPMPSNRFCQSGPALRVGQPPQQPQPQGQMSDAGNDIRNPAVQAGMPGGTQQALYNWNASQGNGNAPITPEERANTERHNKIQEEQDWEKIRQKNIELEMQQRKNNWDEQHRDNQASDQEQAKDNGNYLGNNKTGLQARLSDANASRGQLGDLNEMLDSLNTGFKSSATKDFVDNMERFTQASLGISLTSLGFDPNTVTNTNTFRKNLANAIIAKLSTLHFGRITNYEAQIVRDNFAKENADPSTNLKITLAMMDMIKRNASRVHNENAIAYNMDGNDPKQMRGRFSDITVAHARAYINDLDEKEDKEPLKKPWIEIDHADSKDDVPTDQWVEDKHSHTMFWHSSKDGQLYAAGQEIP